MMRPANMSLNRSSQPRSRDGERASDCPPPTELFSTAGAGSISSETGRGTAFGIYLPCSEEEGMAGPRGAPDFEPARGSETILVVDDRAEIRDLIADILESHGFHVLTAADGQEALKQDCEYAGRIDLLLTDVVMPGMTGRQIAERFLDRHPGIKVLYTSGYSGDAIASRELLDPEMTYLPKPFTPDLLLRKMRQVLGTRANGQFAKLP